MMVRVFVAMSRYHCLVFLAVSVGCGSPGQQAPGENQTDNSDEHADIDPHDVPITEAQKAQLRQEMTRLADAITKITEFRNTIEKETADGIPANPFQAHQALDQIDLVLQWLPDIARETNVPKEHWEAINVAANGLRESFEKVHLRIDSKQDPDFAGVAREIDENVAELEAIPH